MIKHKIRQERQKIRPISGRGVAVAAGLSGSTSSASRSSGWCLMASQISKVLTAPYAQLSCLSSCLVMLFTKAWSCGKRQTTASNSRRWKISTTSLKIPMTRLYLRITFWSSDLMMTLLSPSRSRILTAMRKPASLQSMAILEHTESTGTTLTKQGLAPLTNLLPSHRWRRKNAREKIWIIIQKVRPSQREVSIPFKNSL